MLKQVLWQAYPRLQEPLCLDGWAVEKSDARLQQSLCPRHRWTHKEVEVGKETCELSKYLQHMAQHGRVSVRESGVGNREYLVQASSGVEGC